MLELPTSREMNIYYLSLSLSQFREVLVYSLTL